MESTVESSAPWTRERTSSATAELKGIITRTAKGGYRCQGWVCRCEHEREAARAGAKAKAVASGVLSSSGGGKKVEKSGTPMMDCAANRAKWPVMFMNYDLCDAIQGPEDGRFLLSFFFWERRW